MTSRTSLPGMGEARRPALEVVRQLAGKNVSDRRVVAFDEQLYPRPPVMVRRALGVEAQDLGAWTDQTWPNDGCPRIRPPEWAARLGHRSLRTTRDRP